MNVSEGQFEQRPGGVVGLINEPLASGVIYPAVLGAWTFIALAFSRAQAARWSAACVFLGGVAILLIYNLKLKREEDRRRRKATRSGRRRKATRSDCSPQDTLAHGEADGPQVVSKCSAAQQLLQPDASRSTLFIVDLFFWRWMVALAVRKFKRLALGVKSQTTGV